MLHSTFPESTRTSSGQAIWHCQKRDASCNLHAWSSHSLSMTVAFCYVKPPNELSPTTPSFGLLSVLTWSFYFNMVTWLIPCNLLGHTVTRTQWIYVTQSCLIWTQQLEKVFPSCAIVAVASPIMQQFARLVSSVAIAFQFCIPWKSLHCCKVREHQLKSL